MSCRIYLFPNDRILPKYWETHHSCVGHLLAAQLAMTQLEAARRHHLHLAHTSATAPPLHGRIPKGTTTKGDPVNDQHDFVPSEATPCTGQRREAWHSTHTLDSMHTHDGTLPSARAWTPWNTTTAGTDPTTTTADPNNAHTMYASSTNAEQRGQRTSACDRHRSKTRHKEAMPTWDEVAESTPTHTRIEPPWPQNEHEPLHTPPQPDKRNDKTTKNSDKTAEHIR